MTAREGLFKAAGIVAAVSILSKLLGFIRETSMAAIFGATHATDAYLMGQTIPLLLFASVGTALGTTFIPVFSQVRQTKGQEAAFRMASSVINVSSLLAIVFIVAGEVLAGPLTRAVAPGFRDPVYGLTVEMTRIMFPMVLFQVLAGLMTGILQSAGSFTVPALVSLAFNITTISAILALGTVFGIRAVAVSTVISMAAQVVLLVPALRRLGYRWHPVLDLRDPGLRRIAVLVGPVLAATTVGQIGTLVNRMLASGLAPGSVAALNYASRLMGLVPGVIGLAITTVMYPAFADLAVKKDWPRFGRAYSQAVRMINFVMVPAAVGMAMLRRPLVQIVYERGAFSADATTATAWPLLFFSLGLAVSTVGEITSRAFFAFQDTRAPMLIGVITVGINIVLNFLLVGPLRQGGLALATSLAWAFSAGAQLWVLHRRIRAMSAEARIAGGAQGKAADGWISSGPDEQVGIGGSAIISSLWRVVAASGVLGGIVSLTYSWLLAQVPGSSVGTQAVRLFGAAGAGVLSYAALVRVFHVPEAKMTQEVMVEAWRRGLVRIRSLLRAWGWA